MRNGDSIKTHFKGAMIYYLSVTEAVPCLYMVRKGDNIVFSINMIQEFVMDF